MLPAALAAAQAGRGLVVPAGNGAEAALAAQVEASTARTLLEVCALLDGRKSLPRADALPPCAPRRPTWPMCAARRMRGARWRSPPRAGTTCC